MSIQSVPLSSLQAPLANPRSTFDASSLDGLAASIKADGLLQNLIVEPGKGRRQFRIIGGERRFRALKLLQERGDISADYQVRIEVRTSLTKDDRLRLATIENMQREDLPPLDQAEALAALIRKGTTLDDLLAKTGLSATTIKRRLALNCLCDEAKAQLRGGQVTLAQAEALTLGDEGRQRDVLEEIEQGRHVTADDIREHLLDEKPSVAMAIFPRERYTGTITTDLFQTEEASYFDDAEAFITLQRQAVEELARTYEGKTAFVDVTDEYRIPEWQYENANKRNRKRAGVVINLSPRGTVEVREGLVKPKTIDRSTAKATASAVAPSKPKAIYPMPLRRYFAWHKTVAVQEVLLSHPRKAKEVAAVHALLALKPHAALRELRQSPQPQIAYEVLETQAAVVTRLLGLTPDEGDAAWQTLSASSASDDVDLYRRIAALTDAELDQLHTVLAVLPFGQVICERLDSGDSLFNAIATDLKLDMRQHWKPDAEFLNRRTREQLVAIATECGYAEGLSGLHTWKKNELVQGLLRHFEQARQAGADATDAQRKALSYLPDAMLFPAINPDASSTDDVRADDEPPFDTDDSAEAE